MPMKKATKDRLAAAFQSGYRAGYTDGRRAAEVEMDASDAAEQLFMLTVEDDGEDTASGE